MTNTDEALTQLRILDDLIKTVRNNISEHKSEIARLEHECTAYKDTLKLLKDLRNQVKVVDE